MKLEDRRTEEAVTLATRTAEGIISGETMVTNLEARAILRQGIREMAHDTLYGHPLLPDVQLEPIAAFYCIPVEAVTFLHIALYKQAIEAGKGSIAALNALAAFAGEKPK